MFEEMCERDEQGIDLNRKTFFQLQQIVNHFQLNIIPKKNLNFSICESTPPFKFLFFYYLIFCNTLVQSWRIYSLFKLMKNRLAILDSSVLIELFYPLHILINMTVRFTRNINMLHIVNNLGPALSAPIFFPTPNGHKHKVYTCNWAYWFSPLLPPPPSLPYTSVWEWKNETTQYILLFF